MAALAKKVYLALAQPDETDATAGRERLLCALEDDHVHITAPALQELYPTLSGEGYRVTVTLCPSDTGWDLIRVEPGDTQDALYGAALDIGSTNLALELLHLPSGQVLAHRECTNSQVVLGTNILDRIFAIKEDGQNLARLQELVLGDIRALLDACLQDAGLGPDQIAALCVGGNTTMIHFLYGCDAWPVFQTPYAPVFFDPGIQPAAALGLGLRCNVLCLPAVANYLGGDITAGLLLTDLDTRKDPAVFLDIGTNGELALGCRDYLLVGAGAAGPALEGGVSLSGMRAEPGAVCSVRIDEQNVLHIRTIGDRPPEGICGSGIVDLIAEGYLAGWLNADGTLNPDASERIRPVWQEQSHRNVPAIVYAARQGKQLYFTQDDIAEFIRCKAAAHTMVATLLDASGVSLDQIGAFYLSGGFGTHLNLESAIAIGMYPDLPRERFRILGNSSLTGAKRVLLDAGSLDRVRHFVQMATYVQFGEIDTFLENMRAAQFLPHTNAALYPSVRRRNQKT